MEVLASYPITEEAVIPHCGKPVAAVTCHGDIIVGTIKSCANGQLILVPYNGQIPAAAVQSIKQAAGKRGQVKAKSAKPVKLNRKAKVKSTTEKAKVNFYPYGYGAGWDLVLPLFVLTALISLPWFWF